MMLRLYGRGNFTLESELARRSFETQATDKLVAVKGVLPRMDRNFWRCCWILNIINFPNMRPPL